MHPNRPPFGVPSVAHVAWLLAKGRYVVPVHHWNAGDIDLAKKRFASSSELLSMISARMVFLANYAPDRSETKKDFQDFLARQGASNEKITVANLANPDFVGQLAALLDFPVELFALRAREALAKDALAATSEISRSMPGNFLLRTALKDGVSTRVSFLSN